MSAMNSESTDVPLTITRFGLGLGVGVMMKLQGPRVPARVEGHASID